MRKFVVILLVLLMLFTGTACGSKETIAQLEQDVETLQDEKGDLHDTVEELEQKSSELETTITELEESNAQLTSDKASLEKQVASQEETITGLEAKVAEAATWYALSDLEKEEQAALLAEKEEQKRLEAEKKAEEERLAKEAEEKKGYNTGITFDNIARKPDDYEGEKVKFSGRVIQVIHGDTYTAIRFAIDRDYDKVVYCQYKNDIVESRILEDDRITIYGISRGLMSYESTGGSTITVPEIWIDKIDQ